MLFQFFRRLIENMTTTAHKKATFTLEKNGVGFGIRPKSIVHTVETKLSVTHKRTRTLETRFPSKPPSIASTRPIACKITLDHQPLSRDEAFFTFLQKQFPPTTICEDLSKTWPYGRVFVASSGYHREFFTSDWILSIIFLGSDEVSAIREMQKITAEHMYVLSLQELF